MAGVSGPNSGYPWSLPPLWALAGEDLADFRLATRQPPPGECQLLLPSAVVEGSRSTTVESSTLLVKQSGPDAERDSIGEVGVQRREGRGPILTIRLSF